MVAAAASFEGAFAAGAGTRFVAAVYSGIVLIGFAAAGFFWMFIAIRSGRFAPSRGSVAHTPKLEPDC